MDFMKKVKELGFLIKLDTNGSYPDRLQDIVSTGLVDYVAMDIKNCREKYPVTVGLPSYDIRPIEESVAFLLSGAVDFEFRTTVVREFHTVEDVQAIGEWIAGVPRYFLQNFVDSGALIGEGMHSVSPEILQEMQKSLVPYGIRAEIRGL
jgi:pyruvate formate lyase activating enzyme